MPSDQPATPKPRLRWFHLTPGCLLVVLLIVEGILLLSERWLPKGWSVLFTIASVCMAMVLMLLWYILALLFRWRFQFSIRSLLVLTIAVAIPFSWLALEMKWAREQKKAVETLMKMGGSVYYEDTMDSSGRWLGEREPSGEEPPDPAYLRKMLGNDFFGNVTQICLDNLNISDADLEYCKGMTQLIALSLDDTPITDAGLKNLKGSKQLQTLALERTQITDAGLEHLKGIDRMQYLDLGSTQITDAGLKHMEGLKQLKYLFLNGTKVTDVGVKQIQEASPNLQIQR